MSRRKGERVWEGKTQVERTSNRHKCVKQEDRAILDAIKHDSGCVICGLNNEPGCVFDFHHVYENTKVASVSHLAGGRLIRLITELHKCVVICANCHRKVTYKKIPEPVSNQRLTVEYIQSFNWREDTKLQKELHSLQRIYFKKLKNGTV